MAAVKNPPKKSAVKKTATKKVKSNGSATAKVMLQTNALTP